MANIHTGREIGGDTTETEGTMVDNPTVTNGDLGTGRGSQGGGNGRGTQQQKQACVAGRRYERRRLAGGGSGKIPGVK